MTKQLDPAELWAAPAAIPDLEPPYQVVMASALTTAMSTLGSVHRAAVLMKIERIAELAGWGELRGHGRFTIDSPDLLHSIHLEFGVDATTHRVVFANVDEPRY